MSFNFSSRTGLCFFRTFRTSPTLTLSSVPSKPRRYRLKQQTWPWKPSNGTWYIKTSINGNGSIPIICPMIIAIYHNNIILTSMIWLWINTYENTIKLGDEHYHFNPAKFWCEQKGYYLFWHTAIYTWYKPSNMMQNGKQQTQLRLYKVMFVNH